MQHGGLDEHQLLAVADVQAVTGFDRVEVPLRVVMMAGDGVDGVVGAVDGVPGMQAISSVRAPA